MFDDKDAAFMRQALTEARKGRGLTSPNPCVGAVIVKDNQIVGRGFHKKAGTPHAEIHALRQAGAAARGATMYVTLEPCSHHGRTPPCSPAVAAAGIKKVIIGMLDPNPLVDGGGVSYLREKGIAVIHGLLEKECRDLNRPFIKLITSGRPLVIMKAGLTLDGRITLRKGVGDRITGPGSEHFVHRLRNRCDGIMVGIGTIEIDNPSLTTRIAGRKGHDPVRIIVDTSLRIAEDARVLTQSSAAATWIFCAASADFKKAARLEDSGASVFRVATAQDGRLDLVAVLRTLGARQLSSLLVEGGAALHGSLLNAGLVDQVQLFFAPIFAGDNGISVTSGHRMQGDASQAVRLENVSYRRCGDDMMVCGDVSYPADSPDQTG
jgi:diaminohydroxyphosphoribosylaminopyrimidine deaminase/5-amino-6-(5-phosphoribosylamino)uracil reductase